MDMLWRAFYAMGKILRILLEMFVAMLLDTLGDVGRMGVYMKRVFEIASSEMEVNPIFTAMFLVAMFLTGMFIINQVKDSIHTVIILAIIVAIIFAVVFLVGV